MAATAAGLALAGDVGRGLAPTPPDVGHKARPADDPTALALDALARFRGVKRRQEVLLSNARFTVIEDFGHHPTALAETLRSLRARFPAAVLTAVFEPRSNTSRLKSMQAAFTAAFAHAHAVYLGPVHRAEKLAADERLDPAEMTRDLGARGVEAHGAASNAALLEQLIAHTTGARATGARAPQPRVVVFFSNGSFDGIIGKYVAAAKG